MHRPRAAGSSVLVAGLFLAASFAGLFGFAPRAAAGHDGSPWSDVLPQTFTANEESHPTILSDDDAWLYAFYLDYNPGTGRTDLRVMRFSTLTDVGVIDFVSDSRVNPVAGTVALLTPLFQPSRPSAGIDSQGNLFVAWTSDGNDVYVSGSSNGGSTWPTTVRVSLPNSAFVDVLPSLAIGPDDRIWVAWIKWVTPGDTDWEILVASSTDGGLTYTGPTNAAALEPGIPGFFTLDLEVDTTGRVYVAYTRIDPAIDCPCVANFSWSSDGTTWATPRALSSGTAWTIGPNLEVDAAGRLHAVWSNFRPGPFGGNLHAYRRSSDRGATWSVEMSLGQGWGSPSTFGTELAVAGDAVMVAWDAIAPSGDAVFSYVVSGTGGDTWGYESIYDRGFDIPGIAVDVDPSGVVWAAVMDFETGSSELGILYWNGPPSRPSITTIARGTGQLTLTWTRPPEADVAYFQIWRSSDGVAYDPVASVAATTTTFADRNLANGTYWYMVLAVDTLGTSSHFSAPKSATVGTTTEDRIAQLEAGIAALQAALAADQADLDALRAALDAAQADLDALQASLAANQTELQSRIANLEAQVATLRTQLSAARAEQATLSLGYTNLAFEIVVVALLAVLVLQNLRRPRLRTPYETPPPPPP